MCTILSAVSSGLSRRLTMPSRRMRAGLNGRTCRAAVDESAQVALDGQDPGADAGGNERLDRFGVAELHDRLQLDPGRFEPACDDLVGLARALAQDQVASREVLRSGVLRQVALAAGEEGHHRVFPYRLDLERGVLPDGHRDDADIELVVEDARDDAFRRADGDGDLQVGVRAPQPGEHGRQEIGADRHRRSQARPSQPPFAVAAHRGERLFRLRESRRACAISSSPAAVAYARLPMRSTSRTPSRFSSSRICRLTAGCVRRSLLRGRREAAERDDFRQGLELVEVEVAHGPIKRCLIKFMITINWTNPHRGSKLSGLPGVRLSLAVEFVAYRTTTR